MTDAPTLAAESVSRADPPAPTATVGPAEVCAGDPLHADPRILVAEDDLVSRRVVETLLRKWGYEVLIACDGLAALEVLSGPDAPRLALLDWMMPGLDGPDVCRRVRDCAAGKSAYLILLTSRGAKEDVVTGLQSGADDYLTKPFDRRELQARLQVGRRILGLQQALAERVRDLESALARVKQLHGLLPICSYCKKIRDDRNYWQRVEEYISRHADVRFSHGICPECWDKEVCPQFTARGKPPPPFPG